MHNVVLVYTDCLDVNGKGDFIICTDCNSLELIQIGGTACGVCEGENLQWADENHQECTIEELKQMGYIVMEI